MKLKIVIAIFFAGLALLAGLLVVLGRWLDGWLRLPALGPGVANPAVGALLSLIGGGLVVWSVYVQFVIGKGTPAPMVATQRLVVAGPYAYSRNPMTLGALDYKRRTPFLLPYPCFKNCQRKSS